MANLDVILNGEINAVIANAEELNFDFSNDFFSTNVTRSIEFSPEFVKTNDIQDGVGYINQFIQLYTILQKLPIDISDPETGIDLLNGYVDLSDSGNAYDDEKGIYKLKCFSDNEDILKILDGLNLRDLIYTEDDFIYTAYILDLVPDFFAAVILAIATFLAFKEIFELGKRLVDVIADGVGSIASGIALAAYIALQVVQIIALLQAIRDALYQNPLFYRSIDVKYLFEKAAASIGYQFQSNVLDTNFQRLRYIHDTSKEGVVNGRIPRNNPVPDRTFLEFAGDIGKMFDGKITISNNVIRLEPFQELLKNPNGYVIRNLKRNGTYSYNSDELYSSLTIEYTEDFSDLNIKKNNVKATYELVGVTRDKSTLNKNERITLPYAVATRKEQTRGYERAFNALFDTFNGNGITVGSSGKLGNRTGFMTLNQNVVSVPRVFIGDADRPELIDSDSLETLKARTLLDNHYTQSSPLFNQWMLWKGSDNRQLCDLDVIKALYGNPIVTDEEGNLAVIQKNVRSIEGGFHEFEYRTKVPSSDKGYINPAKFNVTIKESFFEDELGD